VQAKKQMRYLIFILVIFISIDSFGQNKTESSFNSSLCQSNSYDLKHYPKTDFSFIDSIELWNYQLDTTSIEDEKDSIKSIGQLIFWRTKPIDDGISKRLYRQFWTPYITFDLYKLADSVFCYKKSIRTKIFSSCVAPDVGGDIIKIGCYILLNHDVCLSCQRHDTKKDYCRPVLKIVFSKIDKNRITTLESFINQIALSKGQLKKREKRTLIPN
jgi:hypothetical protein